jgi:PAS domain S-box-containing protein
MDAVSKRLRSSMAQRPQTPAISGDAAAVVAFMTSADGCVQSWSREAEDLFGYNLEDIVNRSWAILVATDGEAAVDATTLEPSRHTVRRFRRRDRTEFVAHHATVELRSLTGIVTRAQLIRMDGVEQGPAVAENGRQHAESVTSLRSESAELRYSEQARIRLLRRLVIAQEEERRRIAGDLHDHLGQQLTSLRLKLEAVRTVTPDLPNVQATLTQADAVLTRIDRDIDFLSWELRPAALDDLGLKAVLDNYVREWAQHAGVRARFHVEGLGDERVAPEIEATLYRIAQEALNNVARHARAQSVSVVLERRARTLSLVIEDDGVGFDTSTISNTMIGLVGMRERAAVVGGSFDIEPTAGGGTTVLARVPLYLTDLSPLVDIAASSDSSLVPNEAVPASAAGESERTAQLQRAVAARDEFIATVAHELRNPIAPLMFQIRLSIEKAEQIDRSGAAIPAEWARGQLRRIEQRLHRLLETLDRLLDVSRLSSGRIDLEFETVDLTEVVRDVIGSFEAELAVARCEARVTTPAAVIGWWDRLRLDQICRNLVSNAIRFGAGHPIHVTVASDDTDATLVVRDYGVGIPADKQEVIFERFERGPENSRSGGFGIGLWVVRNICAAMGGSVTVKSAVGVGSTFAVSLPRRPERDQRQEESK